MLPALVGLVLAVACAALALALSRSRGQVRAQAEALEDAEEALARAQAEVGRAQAGAAQAQSEAEAAQVQRARFLAAVSREVRTPLTGVVGMASLLQDSELSERQRQQVRTIQVCGDALLEIVNDALELSRAESGALRAEPALFSLRALVDQAVELASQQAIGRDLNIAGLLDPGLPGQVVGDAGLLRGVLGHLLSNAVRYTPSGDVVLRVTRRAQGRVRFEVSDSGPGLSEQARATLFEPFAAPGAGRTEGGVGLGLVLSRRVVEHLGGTLDVESRSGRGSTFWFELALPEGEDALPVDPTTGEVLRPSGQAIGQSQGRVLLAEDNPVNQQVAAALLRRLGYTVELADDGVQALERLEQGVYDAVLMDCEMPSLDGLEATRRLRARERAPARTPVIAMTAHALRGDRERCLDAGMDDYIAKPVDLARLGRVLARWVGHGPSEPTALRAPETTEEMASPGLAAQEVVAMLGAAPAGTPLGTPLGTPPPRALTPRDGRTPRLPGSGWKSASTFVFEEPEEGELIVDLSGLRELEAARERGAPSPMKTILHSFLAEAQADLERVRTAGQQGQSEELRRALHRLKGAAATVGAVSLALRCGALEEEVRTGLADDLPVRLRELEQVCSGTCELLAAEAEAV